MPEFKELEKLPLAERVQLVEDLWDSIARSGAEDLPFPSGRKPNCGAASRSIGGILNPQGRGRKSRDRSLNPTDADP